MGNFYCNFSILGPSAETVIATLQKRKRCAYVSPIQNGVTVAYEQSSDDLDEQSIYWLGAALSLDLSAPVLAAINADDDVLIEILRDRL